MNIFYLGKNPYKAALLHGDRHVVKMIVETAQMLSTAHHLHPTTPIQSHIYKPTHINHPCNIWVRENTSNYKWTYRLLHGLCTEFRIRRSKIHKTERIIPILMDLPDITYSENQTCPALAMPDKFKSDDPVQSYRLYYKQKFNDGIVSYHWSNQRSIPDFLIKEY